MTGTEHLVAALRAPGEGASFIATMHAGLVRIEPQNDNAARWLLEYASAEASWDDEALALEMRYFPAFADRAIADGLTSERASRPN